MQNKFRVQSSEFRERTLRTINYKLKTEHGQSLVELVVVIAVAVVVVSALTFAVISSLRNASFAKNQAQATKLAQDGLERVRTIRDRDSTIRTLNIPGTSGSAGDMKFSELWNSYLKSTYCENKPCLFKLTANGNMEQINDPKDSGEVDGLRRYIEISDTQSNYQSQKEISAVVVWTDFSGKHQSKLTTYFTKR